jgi:hypothetical protein
MIFTPQDERCPPIEEPADPDTEAHDPIAPGRSPRPSADAIPVVRHEPLELPDARQRD